MFRSASLGLVLLLGACPSGGPQPSAPAPTPVERARPAPGRGPGARRVLRSGPVTFDGFFRPTTLRVDLVHRGSATTEAYRVVGLVREGVWAGSRRHLLDPFGYGAHRFEIRDAVSGALLYSRGYSSLFGEWRSTRDAKRRSRSFSESIRIPLPRRAVVLAIYSRQRSGRFARVFQKRLEGTGAGVRRWTRDPAVRVVVLHQGAPMAHAVDIAILGDGYTAREADKLLADARRFTRVLLANPTFGPHRRQINVRLVQLASPASGVSEPRKGRVLQTPLGLSFDTFSSPRYLMTEKNLALRRAAAHAPYDALYLMANTSRYGGGGIYNLYAAFPSDNEYSAYVFIHEFGHSFAGLADEYYDSSVSYDDSEFYPKGVEPWEPNITRFLRGQLKWRAQISRGVPVPTPNLPRYRGKVGLFEGAGYTAKGLYRPALDCKMKGKGHTPFCGVCARAIGRMIALYVE